VKALEDIVTVPEQTS